MLGLWSSISWIVYPLTGLTLAFLASVIFSRQRRQWPAVLVAVAVLILLITKGEVKWAVHPAAGLTLALLASLGFHAWRREWPTLLAALVALGVFMRLGAGWAIYPVLALGLAWLTKVVFSGELLRVINRTSPVKQEPRAKALKQARAALPRQAAGMALPLDLLDAQPRERDEVRLQKRLARLERKAQRLGVSLTKEPAPPSRPPPSLFGPCPRRLRLLPLRAAGPLAR
ncbi:CCDC12/cwf18 family protein (plasmid) [Deinococcus sp. KNUC1210]|uniref:CCDC12/cwf18 family protein n=1 Tax=Deinococcus sp. KNUC1210 TaxID=2917691 RepID=UPI001EF07A2C|nr:CCDC12/cwf18 family protein [Deinococcus sp. KNUC1210]ULH17178.1 CCDC12/cwf18 family protein [Deinococcus sp. KNUC1210]